MFPIRFALSAGLLFVLVLVTNVGMAASLPPVPEDQRCKVLGDNPNDGPNAIEMFGQWVRAQITLGERKTTVGDIDNDAILEQMINEWNMPSCVLDDGRPRLAVFLPAISASFGQEADWSKNLDRVNSIKKKHPNAAFSALIEAHYWNQYAWIARGSGYASSVPPDAWKLFRERLEKAEQILIDSKPYASELPNWYEEMVDTQSALGRSAEERSQILLEGATRYKTYFPTYFMMQRYLLPKWGGDWDTMESFISWSVENTKATEGNTLYARLYWNAGGLMDDGSKLFQETRASWPKMKKGFEDLMARHPKSKWNLNNFARFACLAGDKKTFLALRKKMGRDVLEYAWFGKLSIDLCDHKMGYAK